MGSDLSHLTEADILRFWGMVDKGPDCWLWTGSLLGPYGSLWAQGKRRLAHRISWIITHGKVGSNDLICHHCDTPPCVRPDHLFMGSPADNAQDAAKKDRTLYGSRNPASKLNEISVREIFLQYHEKRISITRLASSYGVSDRAIFLIVTRKKWLRATNCLVDKFADRINSGERNFRSKLPTCVVKEIVQLYEGGSVLQREIAEMFEVSQTTISGIVSGSARKKASGIEERKLYSRWNRPAGAVGGMLPEGREA